mgnify:CR=1 FL=1
MKIDRKPDKTVPHHPVQCQGCPYAGQCQYKVSGTRYEYEVIVKTELIAHQVLSCTSCKMTGRRVEGKFPAHINGAKQYGAGVSALTTALLTVGYAALFLRIRCVASPVQFINYHTSFCMQAMGDGARTLLHAFVRELVFYIPFMFLLDRMFGEVGLAAALPVSEGCAINSFSAARLKDPHSAIWIT